MADNELTIIVQGEDKSPPDKQGESPQSNAPPAAGSPRNPPSGTPRSPRADAPTGDPNPTTGRRRGPDGRFLPENKGGEGGGDAGNDPEDMGARIGDSIAQAVARAIGRYFGSEIGRSLGNRLGRTIGTAIGNVVGNRVGVVARKAGPGIVRGVTGAAAARGASATGVTGTGATAAGAGGAGAGSAGGGAAAGGAGAGGAAAGGISAGAVIIGGAVAAVGGLVLALGALTLIARSISKQLTDTIGSLNANTASAIAVGKAQQRVADIQQSQRLASALSEFTRQRTEQSLAIQELKVSLVELFRVPIGIVTKSLTNLVKTADYLVDLANSTITSSLNYLESIPGLGPLAKKLGAALDKWLLAENAPVRNFEDDLFAEADEFVARRQKRVRSRRRDNKGFK